MNTQGQFSVGKDFQRTRAIVLFGTGEPFGRFRAALAAISPTPVTTGRHLGGQRAGTDGLACWVHCGGERLSGCRTRSVSDVTSGGGVGNEESPGARLEAVSLLTCLVKWSMLKVETRCRLRDQVVAVERANKFRKTVASTRSRFFTALH